MNNLIPKVRLYVDDCDTSLEFTSRAKAFIYADKHKIEKQYSLQWKEE